MLKYSIVVPLHNEQENVTELYDRLKAVMEGVGEGFEIVFVDDGSSDATFSLLQDMAGVDSRVVVVKLRRNFGQTSALAAGFRSRPGGIRNCHGRRPAAEPADIPQFVAKLNEGYDIVSGWRQARPENLWLRRIPSRIANWLMAKLSGVEIHDFGTTFKAYRRDILSEVPLYGELHRFIPALASAQGATICEIPITCGARVAGTSHYGISRTFRVFFDLITIRFLLRYLSRPLHFFGKGGVLSLFAGGFLAFWLVLSKLLWHTDVMTQHGPMMIFATVLILGGVQLLGLGLLGEMQARYYHEPERRRLPYSVDCVVRTDGEKTIGN